jgi:hypothetical protein
MKSYHTLVNILSMFGCKFEPKQFIMDYTETDKRHWVFMDDTDTAPIYTMETLNETWCLVLAHDHVDALSHYYPDVPFVDINDAAVNDDVREIIYFLDSVKP